jgi:hypothetical protein
VSSPIKPVCGEFAKQPSRSYALTSVLRPTLPIMPTISMAIIRKYKAPLKNSA